MIVRETLEIPGRNGPMLLPAADGCAACPSPCAGASARTAPREGRRVVLGVEGKRLTIAAGWVFGLPLMGLVVGVWCLDAAELTRQPLISLACLGAIVAALAGMVAAQGERLARSIRIRHLPVSAQYSRNTA